MSVPLSGNEGHAGVKANRRVLNDQWIVGKSFIQGGIRYHENIGLVDGVSAKREIAGRFLDVDPDLGFKPLSMCVDQADERE